MQLNRSSCLGSSIPYLSALFTFLKVTMPYCVHPTTYTHIEMIHKVSSDKHSTHLSHTPPPRQHAQVSDGQLQFGIFGSDTSNFPNFANTQLGISFRCGSLECYPVRWWSPWPMFYTSLLSAPSGATLLLISA